MLINTSRRKRRRRPTMTPRFGSSTVALEIGLLRLTLDMHKELTAKDEKKEENK